MAYQETLTDVPADRVDAIVSNYQQLGATVQKIDQGGGLYTLIATFKDVPWSTPFATANLTETIAPIAEDHDPALPPIKKSKNYSDLADEYRIYFDTCVVRPEYKNQVDQQVGRLLQNSERYKALGPELKIPWYFIGIIHSLESDLDFNSHLHNGDPLSARTKREPPGRPAQGEPPFTWEESARDALTLKKLPGQSDWSTARMLYRWESYNGLGYRNQGLASPYLWSYSQHYTKGRFVRDHEFDPNAVSKQCGAAVLLKELQRRI